MPVIRSTAHLAHDGLIEVAGGRTIDCWERPERISGIEEALRRAGGVTFQEPAEHGIDPILAIHDAVLVDLLEHVWDDADASRDGQAAWPIIPDTFLVAPYAAGGGAGSRTSPLARLGAHCLDTATPIVAGTYRAAREAVDVALTAGDMVRDGAPVAYALCRPPGHHANRDMYGGYCFFNNAAILAQRLVSGGFRRVAILDVDYHHGNGTQQLFWDRADVLYLSLHGDPARAFPYFSGYADERGAGAGRGMNRNWPLPAGAGIDAYRAALDEACDAVVAYAPDAPLIVSLGFDTFRGDPICDLGIETSDYAAIGRAIGELGMPTVLVQEGGYALNAIGANAVTFLEGLVA